MPPWDAPILTGDHPPSGKEDINAPDRTVVKWQSLHSFRFVTEELLN
jgi:hypothetical protein